MPFWLPADEVIYVCYQFQVFLENEFGMMYVAENRSLTTFKHFLKWTVLCRAVPNRTEPCQVGSIWEQSSALLESEPKRTTVVPFQYALYPASLCDVSYQRSMVRVCELYCAVPSRAELNRARVVRFGSIQGLFWKMNQSGPPWYPFWCALHPTLVCDTLHTNGAQFEFAFRRLSWHGTVRLGMLWTTLKSGPPKRTIVVPFWYPLHPTPACGTLHTNGARFGFAFRRSSWHRTVRFGMLWTTLESGPRWHASRPVWDGYGLL